MFSEHVKFLLINSLSTVITINFSIKAPIDRLSVAKSLNFKRRKPIYIYCVRDYLAIFLDLHLFVHILRVIFP